MRNLMEGYLLASPPTPFAFEDTSILEVFVVSPPPPPLSPPRPNRYHLWRSRHNRDQTSGTRLHSFDTKDRVTGPQSTGSRVIIDSLSRKVRQFPPESSCPISIPVHEWTCSRVPSPSRPLPRCKATNLYCSGAVRAEFQRTEQPHAPCRQALVLMLMYFCAHLVSK
jgi:hypothetical protein